MLNLPKCVVKQSSVLPVADEVLSLPEGVALTRVIENGNGVLKPTTGVADEYFAGFSENRFQAPSNAPMVDTFTAPGAAPYQQKLSKAPTGTDRIVYINDVKATVVVSGTPTTGQVLIAADGTITFAAADAGKTVVAVYRYNLTMQEAAMLYGWDAVPFLRIPQLTTTVFEVGTMFTDQYVLSDDWAASQYAYLGANGQLTTDDTGSKAGVIVGLPSSNGGFLGVEISI